MTYKVFRDDEGNIDKIELRCDADGCGQLAPPVEAIREAPGGLISMGWDCSGGKHFCPGHKQGAANE